MIDPNYRPSNEMLFDTAMEMKTYPYLAKMVELVPWQREKILEFNWTDDILATMLALEMDLEEQYNLAKPNNID